MKVNSKQKPWRATSKALDYFVVLYFFFRIVPLTYKLYICPYVRAKLHISLIYVRARSYTFLFVFCLQKK